MPSLIYKITNQRNNKSYIGWTSQPLTDRWCQHKKLANKNKDNRPFYNALRKYGTDCWTIEIVELVEDKNQAKQKEIEYIELYQTYSTGYNATRGGDGNNDIKMSAESNRARSIALKGKAKNYDRMAGKKHTEESRKKISEAHKGMKKPWLKPTRDQIIKSALSRRSLTKEQFDNIHRLRSQGNTIRTISEQTNISTDLVKKWLKKSWILS